MDQTENLNYHLVELRKRLTWSAAVIVSCTVVAFVFHQQILELLMVPAKGFANVPYEKPIYTELTEFIGVAMKLSLMVGIFVSLPFLLWQLVMFVSPGLKSSEKKYLYILMPVSILVFIMGALFGYFVLFPPAVRFLLTFGSEIATPMIRIGNYVGLMISLLFWMGVVFEIPIVLFFLARLGVVTSGMLSRNRKWAVVGAFILGAIITPTLDPVNQILVALPIIVLYEFGIILSKLGTRIRSRAYRSN